MVNNAKRHCKFCRASVLPGEEFCARCRRKLNFCLRCDKPISKDEDLCEECLENAQDHPATNKRSNLKRTRDEETTDETDEDTNEDTNEDDDRPLKYRLRRHSLERKDSLVSDSESLGSQDTDDDLDLSDDDYQGGSRGDKVKINNFLNQLLEGGVINKECAGEVEKISDTMTAGEINLYKIIQAPIPIKDKVQAFEEFLIMASLNPLSMEYIALRNDLQGKIYQSENPLTDQEKETLQRIISLNTDKDVSLSDILNSSLSDRQKAGLLEDYKNMISFSYGSLEYNTFRDHLRKKLERKISNTDDYRIQIEQSPYPPEVKEIILSEIKVVENSGRGSEEYIKKMAWLELALSLPVTNKPCPINMTDRIEKKINYEKSVKSILDEHCYGMDEPKEMILDFIFNYITNPQSSNFILALEGPKGIGKTNLANVIAKALDRDIIRICLGGTHDSSKLIGHSRTYVGAVAGEIVLGLSKLKWKNPVIYLDEIDKINTGWGSNDSGGGVENTLIHILDPLQNGQFRDEYLGFPIDLSGVIWIISFNTTKTISPILLDRMFVIHLSRYTKSQKIKIALNYLIPQIRKNINLREDDITIREEELLYLLERTEDEEGVRNLKRNLELLFRRLHRISLTTQQVHESSLEGEGNGKKRKHKKPRKEPIIITREIIDKYIKYEKPDESYKFMYV